MVQSFGARHTMGFSFLFWHLFSVILLCSVLSRHCCVVLRFVVWASGEWDGEDQGGEGTAGGAEWETGHAEGDSEQENDRVWPAGANHRDQHRDCQHQEGVGRGRCQGDRAAEQSHRRRKGTTMYTTTPHPISTYTLYPPPSTPPLFCKPHPLHCTPPGGPLHCNPNYFAKPPPQLDCTRSPTTPIHSTHQPKLGFFFNYYPELVTPPSRHVICNH